MRLSLIHRGALVVLVCLAGQAAAQDASFIVEAARAAHAGLESFSAEGVVTTRIDLTETPTGKAARAKGFQGGQLGDDSAFIKAQTRVSRVTLKLRRDGRYRIAWKQQVGGAFTNRGAAWNIGEGDRIEIPEKGVGRAPDRETALNAASGFSGGASLIVPSLFYDFKVNSLSAVEGWVRLPDEKVKGVACQVIGGKLAGQNVIFWFRESDHLLAQRKQILGGGGPPPLTKEEATQRLREAGLEASPQAIERLQAEREEQRDTVRATQGHITLTLTRIVVNEGIPDEALEPTEGPR